MAIVVGVRTESGPSRFNSSFRILHVLQLYFFLPRICMPLNHSAEVAFNGLNLL